MTEPVADLFHRATRDLLDVVNAKQAEVARRATELGYTGLYVVSEVGHPGGSPSHPAYLYGLRDGATHAIAQWFVRFEYDPPSVQFVVASIAPGLAG